MSDMSDERMGRILDDYVTVREDLGNGRLRVVTTRSPGFFFEEYYQYGKLHTLDPDEPALTLVHSDGYCRKEYWQHGVLVRKVEVRPLDEE